jgi:beta-phosphoglucomutase-like phosphatase (HAD superfamily)
MKFETYEVKIILELLQAAKLRSVTEIAQLDSTKRKDGPYTLELFERDKAIDSAIRRIERSKITPPGASAAQKKILEETAEKKVLLSKKKIDEAKKSLKEQGKKITLTSVSQEARIAYNTAKKYKSYILQD